MANNTKSFDELISLQNNTDWDIEEQRLELHRQLYQLAMNWEGQLPDLSSIFQPPQMNWLILQDCWNEDKVDKEVIYFAYLCGYHDPEPYVYEDGETELRRNTPLHYWAECEPKYGSSIVDVLFEIYDRFEANFVDDSGNTHLHVACKYGCYDAVEKFIVQGENPNCLMPRTGDSPLLVALKHGHVDVIVLLLFLGADPNLPDKNRFAPLHWALAIHDTVIAAILLEAGADPNLPDEDGSTPLHLICQHAWDESTSIDCDPRTMMVRLWDYAETVELLLSKGADPNIRDAEGLTPLHELCQIQNGEVALVQFVGICEEHGKPLEIDAQDESGRTALYAAVEYSNMTEAKALMREGADLNLADKEGTTPLHLMVKCENYLPALLREYLNASERFYRPVRIDARDNAGLTALQYAVALVAPEKVDRLLEHGADLSNFCFPDATYDIYASGSSGCKRRTLVLDTLRIIVSLERKGYRMDYRESLTVMKIFTRFGGLFNRSPEIGQRLNSGEDFASIAKAHLVTLNMTLYDLLHVLTEEAEASCAIEDSERSRAETLPEPWSRQAIHRYPYQTVVGQFLGRFALTFFARTDKEEEFIRRMTIKELFDACMAGGFEDYTYLYRKMNHLSTMERHRLF
ncbi:ankyrin-1-like [Trichogramma pretiosum]|uniref:ankyrin-1-like n=1 Tax=Trichogramma pretiosum TaxID=7493 RepID=UPI0006C97AAB|nr:ankyrin-1-like [Trichogramma pretiosum]